MNGTALAPVWLVLVLPVKAKLVFEPATVHPLAAVIAPTTPGATL